jgi:hypothetical protein
MEAVAREAPQGTVEDVLAAMRAGRFAQYRDNTILNESF